MPIYEYVCLDCRQRFDALRPMADADESIPCPDCRSEHVSRMISVFFAQSDSRTISGGNLNACTSCSSKACSTCGH